MAWALYVVIGKYQVVQDLKDSDESESSTLFLCAFFIGTTITIIIKTKTDVPMVYNR